MKQRQHQISLALCIPLLLCLLPRTGQTQSIGNHQAVFDAHGLLRPWTSWRDALGREMTWYSKCPREHGYPRFVTLTLPTDVPASPPRRPNAAAGRRTPIPT